MKDRRPSFTDCEDMHGHRRSCQCGLTITFDADIGRWWVPFPAGNPEPDTFSCTLGKRKGQLHQPFDTVSITRERGGRVCAETCRGCGRFARVVAGSKSADNYWIRTFCKKCGFREGTT